MGCCAMTPASDTDYTVTLGLISDKKKEEKVHKILFLGSGGSGKSTFLKQMSIIHGNGFSKNERAGYHIDICAQILEQMSLMLECIDIINDSLPANSQPLILSKKALLSATFFDELTLLEIINKEIADHIQILWSEKSLHFIYNNRSKLTIDDSINYFFDNIQRIGNQEKYIPTDLDIISVRHRTTGVTSKTFIVQNTSFNLYDVGGQKSERKKWIHCFENVTAVIYVASLSCYNEFIFEDENKSAMYDSLELFHELCENTWLMYSCMILFLNKNDLFLERIKNIPLSICFPNFKLKVSEEDGDEDGDNVYNESLQFIVDEYTGKHVSYVGRSLHVHVTTATDGNNVLHVFNDVRRTIVEKTLKDFRSQGM